MPPRHLSNYTVVYTFDDKTSTFSSIGVLSNGVLSTNLADITDGDKVNNSQFRDLIDVKIKLKMSLLARLKLLWILRERRSFNFFKRLKEAIRVTFEGLTYQIKHIKIRKSSVK